MAMGLGGHRGSAISDINMTPMIDVLLVLLIVFMVIQQGLLRNIGLQIPPPNDAGVPVPDRPEQLVLEVEPGGRYLLNRQPIPAERLQARLTEVFAARQRKVLFVRGDQSLPYGAVVGALDASRAAGVQVIGIVPLRPHEIQ